MTDVLNDPQQNLLARVRVASPESDSGQLDCSAVPPGDPCAVVIMGATGDWTARKLIPSLFHMYQNDRLPDTCTIVGCGRTQLNDEQFRNKLNTDMEMADYAAGSAAWRDLAWPQGIYTSNMGLQILRCNVVWSMSTVATKRPWIRWRKRTTPGVAASQRSIVCDRRRHRVATASM